MEYPIRINKYLRDKGLASRREADKLILAGKVLVNGKRAEPGMQILGKDKVELRGENKKTYEYLAYYKPRGLATQIQEGSESVIAEWRERGLFPIGRLDKESEGLLILTNDGRVTSKILGSEEKFEKEYIVNTREKLRKGIPAIFQKGMRTETFGRMLPAKTKMINEYTLSVVLREGKRHQIRVMLGELGYTVEALKRIRIGHIMLGKLKPGQTRELNQKELDLLF
ncbi:MAG: rRNA pseudouridine synthase [Candidatus Harrisonbacteria bacterium]|nr:rRNA pseudouridine synthase [Candidatus Harrisonbacteria bacterium]